MSQIRHLLTLIFLYIVLGQAVYPASLFSCLYNPEGTDGQDTVALRLAALNSDLQAALESGDVAGMTDILAEEINKVLSAGVITDSVLVSDSYYITGHYLLRRNMLGKAIESFTRSARLREHAGVSDLKYALCLSNLAATFFKTGDFSRGYEVGMKGLEARRLAIGSDSSQLAGNYLNLASICLEMNESDDAISLAEAGLRLAGTYPDKVPHALTADLYQVIGLSLYRNSEFTKSLDYCKEALKLYDRYGTGKSGSEQLILNTMSQLYRNLDQPEEAEKCFKRGLSLSDEPNTREKYLLYINYASFLDGRGRAAEGEKVLEDGIAYVRKAFGTDSREYCLILAARADFARKTPGDGYKALETYKSCFPYLESHPWDNSMKKYIMTDYAVTLFDLGQYNKALEVADTVIGSTESTAGVAASAEANGSYSSDDLLLLMLRYRCLNAMARESGKNDMLQDAVEKGREVMSLLDRQRLEMSEEESRTNLSAYSREFYTGMIDNYVQLYNRQHDQSYLREAFEFSERSKVAGFLASMRELNAAKFSLPEDLVNKNNEIRGKIGLYKEKIINEKSKARPDSQKIATWEQVNFGLLRSRDSLIRIFEKSYPSYYNLKFKSEVTPLDDITNVIGRKANLLSYVLTEEKLYIFVTNRHHTEIITRDIDSSFFGSLDRFRKMLSVMPGTSSVRQPFNEYMDLSFELYNILLKPAEPFLKGDKIIISPDNILSYLPFETLITEEFRSPELLYREAPFALKKYRFSYIYSVTLSSETQVRSRNLSNELIAFAPTYKGMQIDDSLLTLYPNLRGEIRSLPYAVIEAEDAVRQCGGKAFIGENATEAAYKSQARNYKIIHLAMHTLVNDSHPAFSKMIFSRPSGGGGEDGMLNTYEVYNVPINAMMVVLSSCNTGTGMLATGEGILSLARGFLFAGSRSVVMSMWAVEDYSASEVIKSFYKNMRSGETKSSALRSARLKFLRSADQTRSHPYYWATLVIYGDDTPLWFNRVKLYTALLLLLMVSAVLIATVYRGPRS
ncbi:MAG: CHAT domain-containing tetratricopeptide repeat protein [Bacteroidales bacterium]